jgi:hypothetical protein
MAAIFFLVCLNRVADNLAMKWAVVHRRSRSSSRPGATIADSLPPSPPHLRICRRIWSGAVAYLFPPGEKITLKII